jgi:hypothetical protein
VPYFATSPMKRLFGNTTKLRTDQIRRLENLYRRRPPIQFLITSELTLEIGMLEDSILKIRPSMAIDSDIGTLC